MHVCKRVCTNERELKAYQLQKFNNTRWSRLIIIITYHAQLYTIFTVLNKRNHLNWRVKYEVLFEGTKTGYGIWASITPSPKSIGHSGQITWIASGSRFWWSIRQKYQFSGLLPCTSKAFSVRVLRLTTICFIALVIGQDYMNYYWSRRWWSISGKCQVSKFSPHTPTAHHLASIKYINISLFDFLKKLHYQIRSNSSGLWWI